MRILISIGLIMIFTLGSFSLGFAFMRNLSAHVPGDPREVVVTLFWILVIALAAIVYYHSPNVSEFLLYSGIAVAVFFVVLATGQPPLPGIVYRVFSKFGILPPLILLTIIVVVIIGREVALRIKPWINTHAPFTQGRGAQTFSNPFQNPWTSVSGRFVETLYHGTPKVENAQDILHYGFLIGWGNSHGSGLYLGDPQTAKTYTRGTGVIIKVKLDTPASQVADYNTLVSSPDFKNWSFVHGSRNHGDDLSNYTVQVLKKRFLRVNPNFYVALANKTNTDERVVFEGITILGILDAQGNPI